MLTINQKLNLFGGVKRVRTIVGYHTGQYIQNHKELWDAFVDYLIDLSNQDRICRLNDDSPAIWVDEVLVTANDINRIAATPNRDLTRYFKLARKK